MSVRGRRERETERETREEGRVAMRAAQRSTAHHSQAQYPPPPHTHPTHTLKHPQHPLDTQTRTHLHALGDVDEDVGAHRVGAKAPDLLRQVLVPPKVLAHELGAQLGVVLGPDLALVDRLGQAVLHRARLQVQAVVLVRRLAHDRVVARAAHGLAERDDRLGHADLGAAHKVVLLVVVFGVWLWWGGGGVSVCWWWSCGRRRCFLFCARVCVCFDRARAAHSTHSTRTARSQHTHSTQHTAHTAHTPAGP